MFTLRNFFFTKQISISLILQKINQFYISIYTISPQLDK